MTRCDDVRPADKAVPGGGHGPGVRVPQFGPVQLVHLPNPAGQVGRRRAVVSGLMMVLRLIL